MRTNTTEPGESARSAEARRKSPDRRARTSGRSRGKRAYLLRNQGAVVDGHDRSTEAVERGEQARRALHEDALLIACVAIAVFALWFLPVADTRFF